MLPFRGTASDSGRPLISLIVLRCPAATPSDHTGRPELPRPAHPSPPLCPAVVLPTLALLACNRVTRSPAKARETLLSLLTRVNIVPARVIAFGLDWRRSGPQASPDQPRRGARRRSIPSDGELCPQRRHPTADLPGGSGTGLESRRGPALHARSQCPHAEDEGERHRSRRHGGCHAGAAAGTGDRPPHPPGGRGGLHPACRLLGHSVPDGLQSRLRAHTAGRRCRARCVAFAEDRGDAGD